MTLVTNVNLRNWNHQLREKLALIFNAAFVFV